MLLLKTSWKIQNTNCPL